MSHAYPPIGRMVTRPASRIQASSWSIGGETLDRDYAVYANYKSYLGPLGAKAIRVQAGWHKCEKQPGVFDFAWLDEIVDDARAQGVQPWLELSYGNPVYRGGGKIGLGGDLPMSPEALESWDNWARALVRRYKDRVTEWEIWNEPDVGTYIPGFGAEITPEQYTDFFLRTAKILRAEQPEARIYGLALAAVQEFALEFLLRLTITGQVEFLDAVTIHGYPSNPDDLSNVHALRRLLARLAPKVTVRQGETGAPSGPSSGALGNETWSELRQAKWDLRRMLQHHGQEVPFNLFTICDLKYAQKNVHGFNRKGLLLCNDDMTVARPKLAYAAAQRVFSLFDDSLERRRECAGTAGGEALAVYGYRHREGRGDLVTLWRPDAPPVDADTSRPTDVVLSGVEFRTPVLADPLSGVIRSIPRDGWEAEGGRATFRGLPVGDWPVLIAEAATVYG